MNRIAIVGGRDYSERALIAFFEQLVAKYPRATIVTGNGDGAERSVRELSQLHGLTLDVPPLYPEFFGKDALLCQVNSIVTGADVIVVVGSPTSGRAKRATDIWHRLNMHRRDARGGLLKVKGQYVSWREPWNVIALHNVAPAETKVVPVEAATALAA